MSNLANPIRQRPVALWLAMMGIGLLLYSVFTFVPGVLGSVLGLFVPPIVATIVWYIWYPQTDLEDMGLVAGLLGGVGAMVARTVLPPSVEWFSMIDAVPEHYRIIVAVIPIPFAYAYVGFITTRIIRRFTPKQPKPVPPAPTEV